MFQERNHLSEEMRNAGWILIFILAATWCGCSTLARPEDMGVVIARRAEVRSSTAVVAADMLEVRRGDVLDILDSTTVQETGEKWLRVRARDTDNTEGWVEARNVMPEALLDRSRQIAKEDANIPAQADGQLRAGTNLRYSPDRSTNDNILLKLDSGAKFQIVGWKRVARPKSSEAAESDDTPKAGAAQQATGRRKAESEAAKVPEEMYELWYRVRLPKSISPAPAGWVYGRQVELTVPGDIIFYRTGREFVAWERLDDEPGGSGVSNDARDADPPTPESQPGSWVILEKSSTDESSRPDEPDFDRIFVLGYDKSKQEHYTAYRGPDIKGRLPLRVEGHGDSKIFTVGVQDGAQVREVQFRAYKDDKGILKVEALNNPARSGRKR